MSYADDYDMRGLSIGKQARMAQAKGKGPEFRVPHVVIGGIEHKSCSLCCSLKPLDQFGNNSTAKDGKFSSCRRCNRNKRRAERASKNK